ncbi:ceramidase domain-containing protein [Tranquillimonas alkanivorans]|uniref:Ceramidase n=1 Tax=Tranquillimonas alkanivorans TaxID=441119 RepID=A0A1I5M917_9RHOB|nr:ceramidase domain-containing protein [Tranquillimonas alkanivorans]SFP05501.1 Ceramidase [Tranquillimonas alkanivorans]
MDWSDSIDGYCERLGPALWAEPVNAATNLAFLFAAWVIWRRVRGQGLTLAVLLCLVLATIGIGSLLFHTFATRWAATADTTPIGAFILLYLFAANRHFWAMPVWAAVLGTAAFIPWTVLLTPVFAGLPFFAASSFYWPVPVLILLYAVLLRRRTPLTARGLAIGAGILVASLVFRSLDAPLCDAVPVGTHFLWHLLNALMLGWMIEVYRRHRLEAGGAGR